MEKQKKLFTEKQIGIAALLGGPIPPGILIYFNLNRLHKEKLAYITMAGTLLFTVALIYGMMIIPDEIFDKIPSQVFSTGIGLVVYALYYFLVAHHTKKLLEQKELRESNWKVVLPTIGGIILFFAFAFVLAMNEPPFPGEKMAFDGNEIYYDANTTQADVQKLADQLFQIEYFSKEFPNVARLETLETRYVVTLPVAKEFWENPDIMAELQSFKWFLEVEWKNEVTLTLEHYELTGKRLTRSL